MMRRSGLVGLTVLSLFALAPAAAPAELYEWTDDQGHHHVTDDVNQVPERYRARPPAPPPPDATASSSVTAELRELARTQIRRSGALDVMKRQMLTVIMPGLRREVEAAAGRSLSPADYEKLERVVTRVFWEILPDTAWEDMTAELYAKYFTEAEIRELLRFYRTPLGEKLGRLSGVLAAEGAERGRVMARAREAEFKRRFAEELRKEFAGSR